MSGINVETIADIVENTLDHLGHHTLEDLASTVTEHVGWNGIINGPPVQSMAGDTGFRFNVLTGGKRNFRWKGLHAKDQTSIDNVTKNGRSPWRHADSSYGFDIVESFLNASPAQIIDIIEARRDNEMIGTIEAFEYSIWGRTPASDDKSMWGIGNTLAYETANNGKFTANLIPGYADVFGISPASVQGWRNYSITHDDFASSNMSKRPSPAAPGSVVECLRKALSKTGWKAPVALPGMQANLNRAIFTTYNAKNAIEVWLRASNENIGTEGLAYSGPTIDGTPIVNVPALDPEDDGGLAVLANSASNPFIGIDWNTWFLRQLPANWMRTTVTAGGGENHNAVTVFYDFTCNTACVNRLKQFICAAADPWASA
jgi:hypothetical protein